MKKFNNFKKFICEICKDDKVLEEYQTMTENTFLLFGMGFLLPNKDKLQLIAKKVCDKILVNDEEHQKKIIRYFECFCEYLEQLNQKDTAEKILKDTLEEKGITKEDILECEKTGNIESVTNKLK